MGIIEKVKEDVKVEYVDKLKKGFAGKFYGFPWACIKILKGYKEDEGLYAHEYEHYKQWKRLFWLHCILYKFSKKYRLKCEIEAYAKQMEYYRNDIHYALAQFAHYLSSKYNLGIKYSEAQRMLLDKFIENQIQEGEYANESV